jgi:hypothetical protein
LGGKYSSEKKGSVGCSSACLSILSMIFIPLPVLYVEGVISEERVSE